VLPRKSVVKNFFFINELSNHADLLSPESAVSPGEGAGTEPAIFTIDFDLLSVSDIGSESRSLNPNSSKNWRVVS
jgi:hypothetical protein